MQPVRIEHDGNSFECERLFAPAGEALAHDFLVCPQLGECHLVLREATPLGVVTLWDCEGRGHVFGSSAVVELARPTRLDDADRVWPPFDESWLDQAEPPSPEVVS